ncbi:ABC transporter C family member 10-like [Silene latifolia]|uniref:ABC transporter C family member 10-like n=1 Tax=Silene latifolia TaxID=37657 RepID=UPI003D77A87A
MFMQDLQVGAELNTGEMVMDDLWSLFCGNSECSNEACTNGFSSVSHPDSCVNHFVTLAFDVLLLALVLCCMICRTFSKKVNACISALQICSAVYNGILGLVYIGLGICVFEEKLKIDHSFSPVHWWVLLLFQGLVWLLMVLTSSLGKTHLSQISLRILSIFTFLSTGTLSFFALASIVNHRRATLKVTLDILSFLGAGFLLLSTYKEYKEEASYEIANGSSTLYTALNGEDDSIIKDDSDVQFIPYSKAGLFSKISFWWLNPLIALGKEKTLSDEDMPKLHKFDGAESCYIQFIDQLIKEKDQETSLQSALLWTIIACHQKEILISGIFALISILTLSVGPLLINSFIKVSMGKEAFRYEGYVLAILLFFLKIMESLSRRQWYFRTRVIGVKVKALLTALIYKKQLRLSSDARKTHSGGEIMSNVTVDAHRIGELPFWFHQIWTTALQICIALAILINLVGLATIASLVVLILTVLCNIPLSKLQHNFQTTQMVAQDERLKACSEALVNMKVLKFYAWETHFKNTIEGLRSKEYKWLLRVHLGLVCQIFLFWTAPIPISGATFAACYFLGVPLYASNVFTFLATLRLLQEPIVAISDVLNAVIQATVAFTRISRFLEASEVEHGNKNDISSVDHAIRLNSVNLSWEINQTKPTLRNISLEVQPGAKVAICGEVSSGKSTLLAAILGEVPYKEGTVEVNGRIAYVSQTAWIQSGTIRDNILFGCAMDEVRYQETLHRCSLVKDLELLPFGDLTEIGERGVNLSGGQKQRIQLARALYRDADIYLLDDPFSAVDAHTATNLFKEYVIEALSEKTVILVTHQVDFLPAFQCCLLMSDGGILQAGHYKELLASTSEFSDLVNAHKKTAGTERLAEVGTFERETCPDEKAKTHAPEASNGDQLIKKEERNVGDTGFKSYRTYLKNNKSYLYLICVVIFQLIFVMGQIAQNYWMASNVDNPHISPPKLIVVYLSIGICSVVFVLFRTLAIVIIGMKSSESLFSELLNSLFRAPMSFYDSTPLGRILSRVTSDMNIVDLDVCYNILSVISPTIIASANLGLLATITPQVLFVYIPVIYMIIWVQRYYLATAKELMRIQGTTKSQVANHLAESISGAMTIRAFGEEDRFFAKNLNLVDRNSSPFLHNFAASEWLIQRVETLNAIVLSSVALCMVLLPPSTIRAGFVGMAFTYGLSLNNTMVYGIQCQCIFANNIVSVERLNQYMHLPSEAPEVVEDRRPPKNWPIIGRVEICDLQMRYREGAPLVLRGISCTFEGGDRIGIVGRTGSGKTTLIGALFRLVEPTQGKILVDGIDISQIGLHDLRSRLGIIPQDPTLFNGSVRFNLDPLCKHTDEEIWEVLGKCQLKESVQERFQGLDSTVSEDGSNWSMGQRQLFCLGRALLRKSRVLVLDEATASVDNATDMILQKTIRTEFCDCTVITVAHRIPTVMDSTKVLAMSDGKVVEFDEPMKLMKQEGSLFGQLVKEYWSHINSAELQ